MSEIESMQQTHARVAGFAEPKPPNSFIVAGRGFALHSATFGSLRMGWRLIATRGRFSIELPLSQMEVAA